MEREFESRLKPANKKKRVLVVGGGPGGMESAHHSCPEGTRCNFVGGSEKLGGQLNLASVPPERKI